MKEKRPQKPKVLVVLGPTATGKSALAVSLAKKFNGEIISADSRQVYTGLNIGTGKITKKEMLGVPHHLLDVTNPKRKFDVSQYKKLAEKVLQYTVVNKGKLPIIVGGTGFYIDTVISGALYPEVPPNPVLRKKLEKKSVDFLFKELQKKDPRRAKEIDPKNKVRLIRALEIVFSLGKTPTISYTSLYNPLFIGLKLEDTELKEKIHIRLLARMKQGMVREAKKLHTQGLSWKRMEELGLEYRYLALYLQNKISKEEMISELEKAIWQYARRQVTWFKRNKKIAWFHPKEKKKIESFAKKFLK
jgi:tRNA dimethylallyltransferase